MLQPSFKVISQSATHDYGQFILEPLEPGYGHTLGNTLRRVLLSSIPGVAITSVQIKGVRHQFTTLEGLAEDIIELIINLKQIRLQAKKLPLEDKVTLQLTATGAGNVKAGQIKTPPTLAIANPDLVIAHLADKKNQLEIEMTAESGTGYSPAEERRTTTLGIIPIDAIFSPVIRSTYHVDTTRVGRRTDFDKLILEIWTDATLKPKKALGMATEILVRYFDQIIHPVIIKEEKPAAEEETLSNNILNLTVEELDLPTRIANALRKGGYKTVKDLTKATKAEVSQVKNLGEKSIQLIAKALSKKEAAFKA